MPSGVTYGSVPAAPSALVVRVYSPTNSKITPLGDVFFSFLSSDLDLRLLATSAKIIGITGSLVLKVWRTRQNFTKKVIATSALVRRWFRGRVSDIFARGGWSEKRGERDRDDLYISNLTQTRTNKFSLTTIEE
jgi:hypothetical protein